MNCCPRTVRVRAAAALALSLFAAHAAAQVTEDNAKQAAQEVRLLVTEGTAVIGDLQPAINGAKVNKDDVTPDALVNQFKARYQKATSAPFDVKATGIAGDARRAYLQSFTGVVTRYQGTSPRAARTRSCRRSSARRCSRTSTSSCRERPRPTRPIGTPSSSTATGRCRR